MANIPNSSLPFNDNASTGTTVQASDWNQLAQVLQAAINDNFYRIVEKFNLLNANGTQNTSMQVTNTSGVTNAVQMQMGNGITISAVQSGGNITFAFSIANGAITESMLANGILQDVFYTQTALNGGQLDTRYYTQAQVQALINSAAYSKTVQTGTSFPSSPVDGEQFYRTDLHTLYTYDFNLGQWYTGNRPFEVKSMSNVLSPSRQSFTRSTGAGQINGTQVASNVLRLEQGRFHKAPFIEESTTNNLSANQSSIETDTTGFSTAASTLIVTGATISRDTTTYYQGSASLKVVTTATSGEGVETSGISASASSSYTASVWVKAPSGQAMQLLMRDYTNSISATPVSFTGTGQWQRVSITITTGATAVTNLTMAVVTTSATAVTFYMDCLQIENKGYMTTWVTGGVTRNADSLSYTLDKPLASRFIHAFVVKPQQNSSALANRDYALGSIYSQSSSLRYKVLWRQSDGKIHFIKTPDGVTLYDNVSSAITFNAGDNIYVVTEDDQTAGQTTLYIQVNTGTLMSFTLADTHSITDAQVVYQECLNATGSEWNGTIECILHELASGETVSTDEVTALFGTSDWGLGDYPSALPDKVQIGNGGFLRNDSTGGLSLGGTEHTNIGGQGAGNVCANCYEVQGSWYRYDTTKPAHLVQVSSGGDTPNFLYAPSGTGAIAWSSYPLAQVLSGGYKIQSGSSSITGTNTTGYHSVAVTFPTAFSTTPTVNVTMTSGFEQSYYIGTLNKSSTGFTAEVYASGTNLSTVTFDWDAIGQ